MGARGLHVLQKGFSNSAIQRRSSLSMKKTDDRSMKHNAEDDESVTKDKKENQEATASVSRRPTIVVPNDELSTFEKNIEYQTGYVHWISPNIQINDVLHINKDN